MTIPDSKTLWLVGGLLVVLGVVSIVGQLIKRRLDTGLNPAIVGQFHLRVRTWWLLCTFMSVALFLGAWAAVVLFGLMSFWALREFITLTPTRRGDHRALFWVFFLFTPLQYVLVLTLESGWPFRDERLAHTLFNVVVPVFAFLFVTTRVAFAGDYKRFLERIAKIQAGLMISVYCLSHAPALLTQTLYLPAAPAEFAGARLPQGASAPQAPQAEQGSAAHLDRPAAPDDAALPGNPGGAGIGPPGLGSPTAAVRKATLAEKARLLFFFVIVVQLGDVMQYVWAKLLGQRVIAPEISPSKTWEGFFGGVGSATLLGGLLWWATPFSFWQAAGLSGAITTIGFAGGLTMSAIKRDRGVKDYGTLVVGHGGVLDRVDSICFAAPVFYYATRWLLAQT
jgi:phosphatidate cytidylyltransferase